jgi:rhodanese-related sulfurtransferase
MLTAIRALILAAILMVAGCSGVSPSATPASVAIDEFASALETQGDVYTVVNVHIPYEGEIEGTDIQAAYNDIVVLTDALPDKNAPIILYCRSGRMSEIASQALVELGYSQVWDVPGGMNAWLDSGRNLINR